MKVVLSSLFLLWLATTFAHACSCMPPLSVEESFRRSSAVFLASVVEDKQIPERGPDGKPLRWYFTEYATMRVERTWKGPKPGQLVKFKSEIGAGPCGMPSRGEETLIKLGLLRADHRLSQARTTQVIEWLVYAGGPEPFILNMCSRSYELGSFLDRGDIPKLDRIATHQKN